MIAIFKAGVRIDQVKLSANDLEPKYSPVPEFTELSRENLLREVEGAYHHPNPGQTTLIRYEGTKKRYVPLAGPPRGTLYRTQRIAMRGIAFPLERIHPTSLTSIAYIYLHPLPTDPTGFFSLLQNNDQTNCCHPHHTSILLLPSFDQHLFSTSLDWYCTHDLA